MYHRKSDFQTLKLELETLYFTRQISSEIYRDRLEKLNVYEKCLDITHEPLKLDKKEEKLWKNYLKTRENFYKKFNSKISRLIEWDQALRRNGISSFKLNWILSKLKRYIYELEQIEDKFQSDRLHLMKYIQGVFLFSKRLLGINSTQKIRAIKEAFLYLPYRQKEIHELEMNLSALKRKRDELHSTLIWEQKKLESYQPVYPSNFPEWRV
jgi:hypothetical protein